MGRCPCRYGYSFGTAAADVWHKVNFEAMLYPGYSTYGESLLRCIAVTL
jgi:hypothetical protein